MLPLLLLSLAPLLPCLPTAAAACAFWSLSVEGWGGGQRLVGQGSGIGNSHSVRILGGWGACRLDRRVILVAERRACLEVSRARGKRGEGRGKAARHQERDRTAKSPPRIASISAKGRAAEGFRVLLILAIEQCPLGARNVKGRRVCARQGRTRRRDGEGRRRQMPKAAFEFRFGWRRDGLALALGFGGCSVDRSKA